MFKPGRKKVVKAKDTATFKLEFHASHVPARGWDKLQVSLVSVDSGKVASKTGKVPVKNGTCQWSEPLFEAAPISQDANEKKLYKLVVSMGLSRFGILGDITINLIEYLHSTTPVTLALPLQNCNFGSILHVKLQRVLPKSISEDPDDQKESIHPDVKPTVPDGDLPIESELGPMGDSGTSYEVNSPASNKGGAFRESPSSHSFDSIEVPSTPLMEEARLPGREVTGDDEFMSLSSSASSSGRHEVGTAVYDGGFPSPDTLSKPGTGAENSSFSPQHPMSSPGGSSRLNTEWNSPELNSQGNIAGYEDKNRWEASQRRTRLQRTGSVAMPSSWEHEGNQAAVTGMEALKQQLAEETRRGEEVNMKLSMLIAERDSIRQEMEELRAQEVPPVVMSQEWQQQLEEEASRQVKDLQDELDYIKGLNMNLNLQLEKTQESNSELLLEIQDLEKLLQEERDKLGGSTQLQTSSLERGNPAMDQSQLVDSLQKELAELERDSQELTEENLDLMSQLKQANDKLKEKDGIILKLETESKASIADSLGKLDMDILVDDVREKLRASEEARSSLEIQSESLLERATKAEDDFSNALKVIKNLEAAHERLEEEKSEAVETLEKRLREINEQLANKEENYHRSLQAMESLRAEKEAESSAFLLEIDQVRGSVTQFQDINGILQEQLQQEQQKTSKVLQQNKDMEAETTHLRQALDASQAQVKAMELVMTELKSMQESLEMEMQDLQEKDQLSRSRIKELELHTVSLEEETNALSMSRAMLEAEVQELRSLKDKQMLQEDDIAWSKQSKSGLEENISQAQEVNSRASTRRPLEEKNSDANELLQKQTSDFSWKLSEKEGELQELKKRVLYLEDELHRKANALAMAERRLKEQRESLPIDGSSQVSYLTRSLSRANSRVGANPSIPPSREAKELFDLRSKVKLLEGEVKNKAAELEAAKQQSQEQYIQMSMRIERLELANEELVKEHSNSNVDQALKELNNLKGQNAMLFQRENELLARLVSQEALQSEVEILKEEKKELEMALAKFNAAAKRENILKRISTLETELAEVLESNNMYKKQLQSAFAKQQNVHAAALENLGSVDKVINDLAELKRRNLMLESELCDMKERYFNMSLQFAEVEAEREELVMAIRNLRGTKKFVPLRSAIF